MKLFINININNEQAISNVLDSHGLHGCTVTESDCCVSLNLEVFEVEHQESLTEDINNISSCYYGV